MKKKLGSFFWVLKLQVQTSKFYSGWNIGWSVYDGVSSIAFTYFGAKFLGSVTSVAFGRGKSTDIYLWLGVMLAQAFLNVIVNKLNEIFDKRFRQKLELATNERLFNKIYELSQEQFDNQEFNTKIGRAQDSLNQIVRFVSETSWAISSLVRFVSAIGAILFVSPLVAIFIVVSVIPVTLIRIKQNRIYEDTAKKVEPIERIAYRSRWVLIDPETMPEIRVMNAFKKLVSSWRVNMNKSQDEFFETDKKLFWPDVISELFEPLVSFFASIYFIRLLIAGSLGIDKFIFLRGLLEQASSSATALATSFESLHEMSINIGNFNEVYETEPAIKNGTVKVKSPLTIEFKNVYFSYPTSKEHVLEDVSFIIAPSSKLALVGENGAGKSTILKLLLRQYLPSSGSITVNGVDIKDIEQESYYQALSNLSQDFLILSHLTIRDNLLMGVSRKVTDKQIWEALDLVDARGYVKNLKNGLDQRLDNSFDDGSGLSGGQLQRLGVARALLRDGSVMILDEPTSAVDAKAEYKIFNNLYATHADRTTLIVSHRFSTVRKADQIIVMENHKITEYGTHEELIKHGGLYKEMFEAQAEGYK
jgi:ATP-binding cassette subfamily B protein